MNPRTLALCTAFTLTAAAVPLGCGASVGPNAAYQSTKKTKPLPLKVAVNVSPGPDFRAPVAESVSRSFGKSFRDDLARNGPFTVVDSEPDAVLDIQVHASVNSKGGPPMWVIVPCPLNPLCLLIPAGVPYNSNFMHFTTLATLRTPEGDVLERATVTAQTPWGLEGEYQGIYYGHTISPESFALASGERIRQYFESRWPVIQERIQRERLPLPGAPSARP